MYANNYWRSKELYKEFEPVLRGVQSFKIGEEYVINGDNGEPRYRLSSVPIGALWETAKKHTHKITVGGNPDSTITHATRELASIGIYTGIKIVEFFLQNVAKIELVHPADYKMTIEDLQNRTAHVLRGNNVQEKLEYNFAFNGLRDAEGNLQIEPFDPTSYLNIDDIKEALTLSKAQLQQEHSISL